MRGFERFSDCGSVCLAPGICCAGKRHNRTGVPSIIFSRRGPQASRLPQPAAAATTTTTTTVAAAAATQHAMVVQW